MKLKLQILTFIILALYLGTSEASANSSELSTKQQTRFQKGLKRAVSSLKAQSVTKKKKKAWSISLGAEHYVGVYEDADPLSVISASARYKINQNHSVQLVQAMNKLYVKNPGESEVKFKDTSLRYYYLKDKKPLFRLEATLPVSEFSSQQGNISKPAAMAYLGTKFLDKKLSVTLKPFVRYYLNQFTTTVTTQGSGGGNPLRNYQYGVGFSAGYDLTDKWGLGFGASYSEIKYEKNSFANGTSSLGLSNPAIHPYMIDLSTSYQMTDTWDIYAGFTNGNNVETAGGLEVVLFDQYLSQYYLGTSVKF